MKNKKDFELDLLLAVDELLNELNVCFGGIPILLEMKEREYFQDAKDDETIHGLIERYEITKNENNMLNHTFNQSIIKYGKEPQCRQLMEECAELIKATNKMLRYADRPAEPEYYANLVEEIADVEIMLYQLKVMFNVSDDEVFKVKIQKAKREKERLENHGRKQTKI